MDTFEIFGAITTLTASVISAVVAFITKKAYDKADEEKEYVEIKKAIDGIEIKYADNDNVLELMLRNVKELKEYYVISKDQARKSFSAALLICFLGFFIYVWHSSGSFLQKEYFSNIRYWRNCCGNNCRIIFLVV